MGYKPRAKKIQFIRKLQRIFQKYSTTTKDINHVFHESYINIKQIIRMHILYNLFFVQIPTR